MLDPRVVFATGSFAMLANATANFGKIEAHRGSIFVASTRSLIAVPKHCSGVSVEHKVVDMVMVVCFLTISKKKRETVFCDD